MNEFDEAINEFISIQSDIVPVKTETNTMYSHDDVCKLLNRINIAQQNSIIVFYVVKHADGYFKSCKWDSTVRKYVYNWVEIEKAKVYTKPGPAKSRVTTLKKNHYEAEVIELHVTTLNVHDESLSKKRKKKTVTKPNDLFVFKT